MSVDLLSLLARFEAIDDVEVDLGFYRTRVPSVGASAYLNVIFKPADAAVRKELEADLLLPSDLVDFYSHWNGARLFFDRLSVYGCLPNPHPPLNRHDPFAFLPFDLRGVNAELREDLAGSNLLCIGSYGYDCSRVCVRRDTREVVCGTGDDVGRLRASWTGFSEWLSSEIPRVAACFDHRGRLLVPAESTLPGTSH